MRILVAASLAAGCSGNSHSAVSPDATPDADTSHCAAPADPAAPGTHVVYLSFEGVTLTKGQCSDAPTNCTDLVAQDQTVVPPFLDGNPDRVDDIAAIVAKVKQGVAPYSIDIVTTRPASGPYAMVVIGGDPSLVGGPTGLLGLAPANCSPSFSTLSLDFDHGYRTPYVYANLILSDIGVFSGLSIVTDAGDCMCRTASTCSLSNTQICTFDLMANLDPQMTCSRSGPQDEQAALDVVWGCR